MVSMNLGVIGENSKLSSGNILDFPPKNPVVFISRNWYGDWMLTMF